jgi:hypothetical protein
MTQRNQQASPEGSANHLCEILSEIKVPWIETVYIHVLWLSYKNDNDCRINTISGF